MGFPLETRTPMLPGPPPHRRLAIATWAFAVVVVASLSAGDARAQLAFGSPGVVAPGSNSINVCEADPTGFFLVNWKVTEDLAGGSLSIDLPPGIEFLVGSQDTLNGRGIPSGFGGFLVDALGDDLRFVPRDPLPAGASGTIRFKLTYDCRVNALFERPYRLTVVAASDDGTTFTQVSSPINASSSAPYIIPQASAITPLTDAEIGPTYTRGFDIVQTGKLAEAYAFRLCITYDPGLTIANRTVEGVPVSFPPGDSCVVLSEASHPGLPWPMAENERWVYREDVTITDCSAMESSASVAFGCGPADCQEPSRIPLTIDLIDDDGRIVDRGASRVLPPSGCLDEGALITVAYDVEGRLRNPDFLLVAGAQYMYIDPASIEVDYGDGTFVPYGGPVVGETDADGGCPGGSQMRVSIAPFAGDLVVPSGTRKIRVRYRIKTCCVAGLGNNVKSAIIYQGTAYLRFDARCGGRPRARTQTGSSPFGAYGSADIPEYIADGSTLPWRFELNAIDIPREHLDAAEFCFGFSVDPVLTVVVGNGLRWNGRETGDVPLVAPITALGGGSYRACFPRGDYYDRESDFVFDVTYACTPATCGQSAGTSGRLVMTTGDASCPSGTGCDVVLLDETAATTLGDQCCPIVCDGAVDGGGSITRACFGLPDDDNDGVPSGAALDPNLIASGRALRGDEMAFRVRTTIATDAEPSFGYVRLDLRANVDHEALGAATVTVTDADAGVSYVVSGVPATAAGPRDIAYAISVNDVRAAPGAPADFVFADGDGLELAGSIVPVEYRDCGMYDVRVATTWSTAVAADGTGASFAPCRGPGELAYQLVGYEFLTSSLPTLATLCGESRYTFLGRLCIGGGQRVRPFPYEIRPFGRPDTVRMEVPPGMTVTGATILRQHFTITDGVTAQPNADLLPFGRQVGNFFVIALEDYFDAVVGARPNGGYAFDVRLTVRGECDSEPIRPRVSMRAGLPFCAALPPATYDREYQSPDNIAVRKPELAITSPATFLEPVDRELAWDFTIANPVRGQSDYHWIAAFSPSGNVVPLELRRWDTPVAPNAEGFYEIGELKAYRSVDYTLRADYLSCDLDSVIVYAGYDCSGYPASLDAIRNGGLACAPVQYTLYVQPQTPAIQASIVGEPTGTEVGCDDLGYVVQLVNVDNITVYEPTFSIVGPTSEGIGRVVNTIEVAYPSPVNPTDADFVPIGDYDRVIPTFRGPKYVWDLANHVDSFALGTGPGWLGQLSDDEDARRITIRFRARATCAFEQGDFLGFVGEGRAHCGDPATTLLRNARPAEPIQILPAYPGEIVLDAEDAYPACAPGDLTLAGSLRYEAETDGGDTLVLDLPPALAYASATSAAPELDFANAVVEAIPDAAGPRQRLLVPVLAGRPAYERMRFDLTLAVDRDALACGAPVTLSGFATHYFGYDCVGDRCERRDTTATLAPVPIRFRKDSISLGDFRLAGTCAPDSLAVERLSVTVTNAAVATGADLPLAIFVDADGDGRYDASADRLVATVTLPQNTPAGATVDLAPSLPDPIVIDAAEACDLRVGSDGCTCDAVAAAPTAIRLANAGDDVEGCAPESVAVGCGPDLSGVGYAYAWQQITGNGPALVIADPGAAQTTLTPSAPIENASATYTLALTTTGPGACFSTVDTVAVTFEGVTVTTGPAVSGCAGTVAALSAPGDPAFRDGAWSPTAGLADPTDPNTAVALAAGATDYAYTYRLPDGCLARFEQRATGIACVDLSLVKSVREAPTAVGDTIAFALALTNEGPAAATGVVVADALAVGLRFARAEPAGQYDPASGRWVIPGAVAPGATAELVIYAIVEEGGLLTNVAEVAAADQPDVDSTPGNGVIGEDDMDAVCAAVALTLECGGGDVTTLRTFPGVGAYQWFRDGIALPGAPAATLDVSAPGRYTVEIDGGASAYPTACPVDVTLDTIVADTTAGPEVSGCVGSTATLSAPDGPDLREGSWSPVSGLADPTDPNTAVALVAGETDYVYTYRLPDGCRARFAQRVAGIACVDLSLAKSVCEAPAAIGDVIAFAITLTNEGATSATGVVVADALAAGLQFERAEPAGQYDPVTGRWTIPGFIDTGQTVELIIYATVTEGGLLTNVAEVVAADQPDVDSTPGNGVIGEDDMDAVCAAVALTLECGGGDVTTLRTFPGVGAYQWFRDGIALPGAPAATLDVSAPGRYTVEIDGGASAYPTACPVDVTLDTIVADTTAGPEVSGCVGSTATLSAPDGPDLREGSWSPVSGLADPTDPNTAVALVAGETDYVYTYRLPDGCRARFAQRVAGIACVDLSLAKSVCEAPAAIGDVIAFAITLTNEGATSATGVVVADALAAGLQFERAEPAGQYDPVTGRWTIPGFIDTGQTVELIIYATVTEGGLLTNVAEVVAADQPDVDSTPGNGVIGEDDMDAVCAAVALTLDCGAGDTPVLRTFPGVGAYQWSRDGVALRGETAATLEVALPGRYAVEIDGGASAYPTACPVEVTRGRSCGEVGDRVWLDADADGLQDAGEAGVAGVAVRLYREGVDEPSGATVTDAEGRYRFADVPPGTYAVVFDLATAPYDFPVAFSPRDRGRDDALDSDPDPLTGRTAAFTLTAAAPTNLDVDAGLTVAPAVAAVKSVAGFENLPSGNIAIAFEVGIRNTGLVDLRDITLDDDVGGWFGEGFVRVTRGPEVVIGGAGVRVNPGFDGRADTALLAAGNTLAAGEEIVVAFAVEVDPYVVTWPLYNQARVTGATSLGGGAPGPTVTDLSDSGRDYLGTNPGEPGDRGTADDPTEVPCRPLDNAIVGDGAADCFGASITLNSEHAPAGYRYEWFSLEEGADAVARRIPGADSSVLVASPGAESVTYVVRLFNDGSPVCFYDTEAERTVSGDLPPQVITPNGDGVNDFFRVDCLDGGDAGAQLLVYNRWGSLVYRSDSYVNDWDGTYKGKPLPVGTYFFVLVLPGADGPPVKGVIAVER